MREQDFRKAVVAILENMAHAIYVLDEQRVVQLTIDEIGSEISKLRAEICK